MVNFVSGMKKLALILTLFVLTASYALANQIDSSKTWSLQMCVDYALENNLSIRQSAKQVEIQENNYIQSKYARLPNLNASSNLNFNVGRSIDPFTNTFENQTIASNSIGLSSSVTVYSGNRIHNTIQANEASYQAAMQGYEVLKNQISLQVVLAYLQIVQAEENLKTAESQLELSVSQLERTRKLLEAGTIDQGALYSMEAQVANDRVNKVNAQNQVQLGYNSILNLLQIPIDMEFEIQVEEINKLPEMPTESLQQIYEQALIFLPEVQQGEYQLSQAGHNEKVARSAYYPSIVAFGNLSTVYSESARQGTGNFQIQPIGFLNDGSQTPVYSLFPEYQSVPYSDQLNDNFGITFGASLSVPIFNNMRTSTSVQNAQINSEIAQLQYENILTTLRSEVTTAYTNLLAAKSRYDAAVSNEDAQRLNYEYAQKRFNAGLLNSVDLLNAKNLWFQSQNQLLNAKYEYVFRNLLIQYYLGNPLKLN